MQKINLLIEIYQFPTIQEKDIIVYAEKGRILKVSSYISNMLDNPFEFTHKGSIVISVEVSNNNNNTNTNTNDIILLAGDEGTGIDDEIGSRMFAKFSTKSEKGLVLGCMSQKVL